MYEHIILYSYAYFHNFISKIKCRFENYNFYINFKIINNLQISYRNTSNYEPYLLHVPGCDSVACELDKFTDVLKPMFTVNWYNECKANVKNNFLELLSKSY